MAEKTAHRPPAPARSSAEEAPVSAEAPEALDAVPQGGIDMGIPGWSNNGPPSTGATAGKPGAWTPALSDPPNNLALMTGITAAPATAWTTGQYVTLGDGSQAHWSGSGWITGPA